MAVIPNTFTIITCDGNMHGEPCRQGARIEQIAPVNVALSAARRYGWDTTSMTMCPECVTANQNVRVLAYAA